LTRQTLRIEEIEETLDANIETKFGTRVETTDKTFGAVKVGVKSDAIIVKIDATPDAIIGATPVAG
jgi:hypothetical protein